MVSKLDELLEAVHVTDPFSNVDRPEAVTSQKTVTPRTFKQRKQQGLNKLYGMLRTRGYRRVCTEYVFPSRNRPLVLRSGPSAKAPSPSISTSKLTFYSTQATADSPSKDVLSSPLGYDIPGVEQSLEIESPIRKQLRQWVLENEAQAASSLPPDMLLHGSISNSLTRSQSTGSAEMDNLKGVDDTSAETLDQDIVPDGVVGTASQQPGDLVELRQPGTRVPMLGVYLGNIGERNHFYAANGKWVSSLGFSSMFTVGNFASPQELEPILAKIPEDGNPSIFDKLRENEAGPSREDAHAIISKLTKFRNRAERVYQTNVEALDGARALLADKERLTYLSLFDMTKKLLPHLTKPDGKVASHILYCVYCAVLRCENSFYPMSPSAAMHLKNHLFEVLPLSVTDMMEEIALVVREYVARNALRVQNPATNAARRAVGLDRFAEDARRALQFSKAKRERSAYGILAPSDGAYMEKMTWSKDSKDIIGFLEWWAGYGLFDASSRFHAYGALILRAIGVYQDVPLDQSTAWMFLQETNIITPWENVSRYRVRLPDTKIVRGKGLSRIEPEKLDDSLQPDIAAGSRMDYSNSTVFCIDAPSTVVIDDGISLGRTSNPEEFWIHIHVADPTSSIRAKSDLAKFLELVPESIYLPGHYQAMLPSRMGGSSGSDMPSVALVDQFSLNKDCISLTFSAKVNQAGEILDHKIEPSKLGNIAYLDPDQTASFCGEPKPREVHDRVLEVGISPEKYFRPNRSMSQPDQLQSQEQADLKTLYKLTSALKKKRLEKGAWPYYLPRPSVTVRTHHQPPINDTVATVPKDPYIMVATDSRTGSSLVTDSMVLAGQIAAQWCAERKMPIPFRRDSKPGSAKAEALKFANEELYPLLDEGMQPSAGKINKLMRMTGRVEMSTSPGPYFIQGVDMYSKCTSPLRRFGDMLAHWQIHAAMAYERQLGRKLDASTEDCQGILPFSAVEMRELLPMLEIRERMCRVIGRGSKDWILIALVRAWRFENNPPKNIIFTTDSRWRKGLSGKIDVFGLPATLDVNGLEGVALIGDVQVHDKFEVELRDVNVHSGQIMVKAVRKLPRD